MVFLFVAEPHHPLTQVWMLLLKAERRWYSATPWLLRGHAHGISQATASTRWGSRFLFNWCHIFCSYLVLRGQSVESCSDTASHGHPFSFWHWIVFCFLSIDGGSHKNCILLSGCNKSYMSSRKIQCLHSSLSVWLKCLVEALHFLHSNDIFNCGAVRVWRCCNREMWWFILFSSWLN